MLHENIIACCLSQWAWLIMGVILWATLSAMSYPWRRSRTLKVTKNTHTRTTLTEPTIVSQSGSRLLGQVHKVWPQHAWRNNHTPNRHGTRWDRAPLRVTKNTQTQLWPNRPLWRRVDRVCSVKCIMFGHNGAMNSQRDKELKTDSVTWSFLYWTAWLKWMVLVKGPLVAIAYLSLLIPTLASK